MSVRDGLQQLLRALLAERNRTKVKQEELRQQPVGQTPNG